jgi:ABC-type transport system involved in Fe-S cluster assembly fused permease/ATPase subunit
MKVASLKEIDFNQKENRRESFVFRAPEKFETDEIFSSLKHLLLVLKDLSFQAMKKIESDVQRNEILTGKRIFTKIGKQISSNFPPTLVQFIVISSRNFITNNCYTIIIIIIIFITFILIFINTIIIIRKQWKRFRNNDKNVLCFCQR